MTLIRWTPFRELDDIFARYSPFLGYRPGSLPVSEAAAAEVISLPVYPELTAEQQDAVVDAVRDFYT